MGANLPKMRLRNVRGDTLTNEIDGIADGKSNIVAPDMCLYSTKQRGHTCGLMTLGAIRVIPKLNKYIPGFGVAVSSTRGDCFNVTFNLLNCHGMVRKYCQLFHSEAPTWCWEKLTHKLRAAVRMQMI